MAPHKKRNTRSKYTRVAKASAGSKVISSWWKTSSINRLAKRVTHFTTNSSNTVSSSTSIKQYICDNWVPQRRQKQQRHDEGPSLAQMDSDVIGHIFDFLANDKDNIPAFLALSHTCRTFNNILGNDKMWEKLYPKLAAKEFKHKTTTKERVFIYKALSNVRKWQYGTRNRQGTYNILLQYLEGANGVNDIIQLFLRTYIGYPSPTEEYFIFRGDTIHYITELIQEHIIDKLWTVNLMVIKNLRSGDSYPQVTGQDLRTFDHLYHHKYFLLFQMEIIIAILGTNHMMWTMA